MTEQEAETKLQEYLDKKMVAIGAIYRHSIDKSSTMTITDLYVKESPDNSGNYHVYCDAKDKNGTTASSMLEWLFGVYAG